MPLLEYKRAAWLQKRMSIEEKTVPPSSSSAFFHTKWRNSDGCVFVSSWGKGTKETSKGDGGSGDKRGLWAKAQWLDGEKDLDLDTGAVPSFPSTEVSA